MLPLLDASLSYGRPCQDVTFGDALDRLSTNKGRHWLASLNFRFPLLGRAARAQRNQAMAQQRDADQVASL